MIDNAHLYCFTANAHVSGYSGVVAGSTAGCRGDRAIPDALQSAYDAGVHRDVAGGHYEASAVGSVTFSSHAVAPGDLLKI